MQFVPKSWSCPSGEHLACKTANYALPQQHLLFRLPPRRRALTNVTSPYTIGSQLGSLTSLITGSKDLLPSRQQLEQGQSTLFSILPPEIRALIYYFAFGQDHTFHIVHSGGQRLGHVPCTDARGHLAPNLTHTCWGVHGQYDYGKNGYEGPIMYLGSCQSGFFIEHTESTDQRKACVEHVDRRSNALSLLLICRRIYHEAIGSLYRQSRFDLRHPHTLFDLYTSVLPQRFDAIRSLSLSWSLNAALRCPVQPRKYYGCVGWETFWHVVSTMKGLQHLKVICGSHTRPSFRDDFSSPEVAWNQRIKVLQPLCKVRQVKAFVLEVPQEQYLCVLKAIQDPPYTLIATPSLNTEA